MTCEAIDILLIVWFFCYEREVTMGMDMCYNDQLGLHAFTNLNNTKQLQQML